MAKVWAQFDSFLVTLREYFTFVRYFIYHYNQTNSSSVGKKGSRRKQQNISTISTMTRNYFHFNEFITIE